MIRPPGTIVAMGSLDEGRIDPLVVDEAMRGRGYGRALVNDVECLAAGNGALTMVLGTSDEVGRTTLTVPTRER